MMPYPAQVFQYERLPRHREEKGGNSENILEIFNKSRKWANVREYTILSDKPENDTSFRE
jgi:hypothetical protein